MAETPDSKRTFVQSPYQDSRYAYQFMAYRHLNRMGQILLVMYMVFSVVRVSFYSALMAHLSPVTRAALYPFKRIYWFVSFQWQKRMT